MEPNSNILWGLVVKPGKRYETTVQEPFRITKACIEPASVGGKVSSVFIECDNNEEFIIANLNGKILNENLDLSFNQGEKICFKVDGPGTVHLTGNLLDDPPSDMFPEDGFSEEDSEDSSEDDESMEAGDKIKEISDEEALTSLKRKIGDKSDKKEKNKKPKIEEKDTTVDTTLGDLDDTDNFAEENDSESESEDDDDDDDEDDSDEENTTVADTTTDLADTTAADEESSEEEDSDEEEEEEVPVKEIDPVKKSKENKTIPKPEMNGAKKADSKTPKKDNNDAKTSSQANESQPEKDVVKTPKQDGKTSKKEAKTPKQEAKASKEESKTSKQEAKTPKQDAKTPKQEAKTPKQEAKTPKQEAKTPKQEAKTPKMDLETTSAESKTPKQESKTPKDSQTPGKTPKRTIKGGIVVEDLKEGNGPECKKGNMVGMYYEGRLKTNNKRFDGLESGKPFKFKLGSGQVIKGWDLGVLGMKQGGKRRLTIPPQLAYGSAGAPPDIPPHSTLVFDIECRLVK